MIYSFLFCSAPPSCNLTRLLLLGNVYHVQLTVACIKMNRPELAAKAIEVAERRIATDKWPEYYDTKRARFIGKQSRLYQTWSIAGFLVAKLLIEKPDTARILWNDEDAEILNALSTNRKRGKKVLKKTFIV